MEKHWSQLYIGRMEPDVSWNKDGSSLMHYGSELKEF